jgi:hypothetical protein
MQQWQLEQLFLVRQPEKHTFTSLNTCQLEEMIPDQNNACGIYSHREEAEEI